VTGWTASPDFPTTPGVHKTTIGGGGCEFNTICPDAFVTKIPFGNTLRVLKVYPNTGGNAGTITATIYGSGFRAGVSAKLTKLSEPDIIGNSITVAFEGSLLNLTFNLRGEVAGSRDLVVTNPDGTTVVQQNAFTIEQGGAPQIWTDVLGRNVIRGGREQTFYIQIGNRGNIDAKSIAIGIGFPKYLTWQLAPDVNVLTTLQTTKDIIIMVTTPVIPAGNVITVPLRITAPDTPNFAHATFQIRTWSSSSN
jgi:hypothetical protein